MKKEEIIKVIYEKVALKELSSWCKVITKTESYKSWDKDKKNPKVIRRTWIYFENKTGYDFILSSSWRKTRITDHNITRSAHSVWKTAQIEIIWHPIFYGDVIDYIEFEFKENINTMNSLKNKLSAEWTFKRKSIEFQSDNLLNLIVTEIIKG